jgi:UPF0716 protein FxsA
MGRGWRLVTGLVVIGVVVAEVLLFAVVVRAVGVLVTVAVVCASSALGGWLLRREGVRGWRRWRDAVAGGRPSGSVAADGLLGLLAAVLLMVPGFVTDVLGLALLVPPVRRGAGAGARWLAQRQVSSMVAGELFGPRRVRISSRRSARISSSSAMERRSRSMSQWVLGGLAFFCSGSLPSTRRPMLPSNLHSQVMGTSASTAKGTSNRCPLAQRYSRVCRGASSVLRSDS